VSAAPELVEPVTVSDKEPPGGLVPGHGQSAVAGLELQPAEQT